MTFLLALDELTDAELVDRIASGDPASAARFWVRHWPTALSAARGLVQPVEVPGLAAEALIGTLAAIRMGTGPQDHAAVFVIDAVHELGGEEPSASNLAGVQYPDVFASPTLAEAFADLDETDRRLLWAALVDQVPDAELADLLGTATAEASVRREATLGALQGAFVHRHAAMAIDTECAQTHALLASAIDQPGAGFPVATWVHLSECVVCTEAFHELVHTPVALGPLLGAAAYPGPVETVEPVAAVGTGEDDSVAVLADDDTHLALPLESLPLEPETGPVAETETPKRSRRRPVLLLLAAATVAAVVALVISLSGSDEAPAPSAQDVPTTSAAADPTPSPSPVTVVDPPLAHSPTATPTASTATVITTTTATSATTSATTEVTTSGPKPTKSTKPTKSPTTSSPAPTSSAPKPTPSPSPTPTTTPTTRCNALMHLFGKC